MERQRPRRSVLPVILFGLFAAVIGFAAGRFSSSSQRQVIPLKVGVTYEAHCRGSTLRAEYMGSSGGWIWLRKRKGIFDDLFPGPEAGEHWYRTSDCVHFYRPFAPANESGAESSGLEEGNP